MSCSQNFDLIYVRKIDFHGCVWMAGLVRYEIRIDAFEGPLDLLLHLLKETKMDIYDIRVSEVTEQYLNYIKAMEDMHLEVASEYLVMAANLMYIKSKKLLPQEEVEFEDEYVEDSEDELINRLIEYNRYKEITSEFRQLEEARGQFYTKPAIDFSDYIDDSVSLDTNYDVQELISAFEKLFRRQKLAQPIATKIVAEVVTVEERVTFLKGIFEFKKRVLFSELFDGLGREHVVVTFLAMLEMVKGGRLSVLQSDNGDDIEISSR